MEGLCTIPNYINFVKFYLSIFHKLNTYICIILGGRCSPVLTCPLSLLQVNTTVTRACTPPTVFPVRCASPAVRAARTASTPGQAGSGPRILWCVRTSAWFVRASARTRKTRTSCSTRSNARVCDCEMDRLVYNV